MNTQAALRQHIRSTALAMVGAGLNRGTAGNVSSRCADGLLITPSGLPCDEMTDADITAMDMAGNWFGPRAPSSEWRFHRDIYRARPEAGAVIHAHSPFATAIACQRLSIPAFHYMIARFGGNTVRCADYATFGTAELSRQALLALEDRSACLLANHGMLVFGRDLSHALDLAVELETLCEQYWRCCQLGKPIVLSDEEMLRVQEKFKTYGKPLPQQN